MNPTAYLFKSALLPSVLTIVASMLSAPDAVSHQQQGDPITMQNDEDVYVLEDLVVERNAQLENVRYEQDGSLSLLKPNVSSTYEALNSGIGVAVNFEISFAANSIVLTADGQHTVDRLARVLRYMEEGTAFELMVYDVGRSITLALAKRRVETILARLKRSFAIGHDIKANYSTQRVPGQLTSGAYKASEKMAIALVNLGEISSAAQ